MNALGLTVHNFAYRFNYWKRHHMCRLTRYT